MDVMGSPRHGNDGCLHCGDDTLHGEVLLQGHIEPGAGNFGYALIFLQIAIMLASISALTKKRPLFYVGLSAVIGWLFFFLDAILLFY